MSILPGFEDLKPRDVLAFNADGTVLIVVGEEVRTLQVCVSPTGTLATHEIEKSEVDQVRQPKRVPVALRWASTDQGPSIIGE